MYDSGKIWDLTPDGGGPPVQVIVGNPNEAIAAHPERYTREPPEGTAAAAKANRDRAAAEERAKIDAEAHDKLAALAKERQDKLDAIAKEQAEAKKAALDKQREDEKAKAAEEGTVPAVDGRIAAIEAEHAAQAELVTHEADEKRKALELTPQQTPPFAPSKPPVEQPPPTDPAPPAPKPPKAPKPESF